LTKAKPGSPEYESSLAQTHQLGLDPNDPNVLEKWQALHPPPAAPKKHVAARAFGSLPPRDDLCLSVGAAATFQLKSQNEGSWENNSFHGKTFAISGASGLSAFRQITITLTSHNGAFETDDNWNIENLNVTVSNSGASASCILNVRGDPLVRLTGSGPSAIFNPRQGC